MPSPWDKIKGGLGAVGNWFGNMWDSGTSYPAVGAPTGTAGTQNQSFTADFAANQIGASRPPFGYQFTGPVQGAPGYVGTYTWNGQYYELTDTMADRSYRGAGEGGAGAQWRSGEYELQVRQLDLQQRQLELENENADLDRALKAAMETGDLQLRQQIERRQAQNAQDQLQLQRDEQAASAELAARQLAANVYSTQMGAKSSLANTIAGLTTQASQWAANPRDVFSYLKLMGAQGQTPAPYSTATAGQNTEYRDNLTGAFNSLFQPAMGRINEAWQSASEAPPGTQAWYEGLPNYQGATPAQQALFRSLPLGQQQALANAASPQQIAAAGRLAPQRSPSDTTDLYNYNNLIAGKEAGDVEAINRYLAAQAPKVMAGGGRLAVNEPAGVFGFNTGRLLATLGEVGPEKMTVRPMRMATGGTVTVNPYAISDADRTNADLLARANARASGGYSPDQQAYRSNQYASQSAWERAGNRGTSPEMNMDWGTFSALRRAGVKNPLTFKLPRMRGIKGGPGTVADHTHRGGTGAGNVGGTYTGRPVSTAPGPGVDNSPEGQLATLLATNLQNQGVDWNYVPGQGYAPTARLLAPFMQQIAQRYPTLLQTILAGRSASGQSPDDFAAEIGVYTPAGVKVW